MAKGFISSSDGDEPVPWTIGSHAANVNNNTEVPRPNSRTPGQGEDQQGDHTSSTNTAHLGNEQQLQQPVLAASPALPPLPPPTSYQLPPQPLPQAQMNALSLQDTENNNVDENSNDQHYQQYTQYHHQYSNHAFVPEPSVRPRRREVPRYEQNYPSQMEETAQRQLRSPSHHGCQYGDIRHRGRVSHSNSPEEHLQRLPHLRQCEDSYAATSRRTFSGHNSGTQSQSHSSNPSIRDWIPLSLRGGSSYIAPPSPEETQQEAQELMENFTREEILSHHLQVPVALEPRKPSWSDPAWQKAGAELRHLADAFAKTEERRQVRKMAEQVKMNSINYENFFQLCRELFSGPGGITRERIVALFTFVADISIFNLQQHGGQFIRRIMEWSLRFIWEHICSWVHQAGGWGVVLNTGLNVLYKTAIFMFALTGTVAFGMYIFKNL